MPQRPREHRASDAGREENVGENGRRFRNQEPESCTGEETKRRDACNVTHPGGCASGLPVGRSSSRRHKSKTLKGFCFLFFASFVFFVLDQRRKLQDLRGR
jgi:hypothetical protein